MEIHWQKKISWQLQKKDTENKEARMLMMEMEIITFKLSVWIQLALTTMQRSFCSTILQTSQVILYLRRNSLHYNLSTTTGTHLHSKQWS